MALNGGPDWRGVLVVVGQLAAGMLSLGAPGVVLGYVFGQAGGISSLVSSAVRNDRRALRSIRVRRMSAAALRFKEFPLFAAGGTLLNSMGLYVPAVLLMVWYGPAIAGLFALAERVTNVPVSLIGTSVSQGYYGEVSTLVGRGADLRAAFSKVVITLAVIALVPSLLLIIFGPALFRVFFGAEWNDAGVVAGILAPWLFFRFVAFPVGETLNALGRPRVLAYWSGLRVLAVFLAFWGAATLWPGPQFAIGAISLTGAVMYLVLLALTRSVLSRMPG